MTRWLDCNDKPRGVFRATCDAEEVCADARGRGRRGDGRHSRYTTAMNNKVPANARVNRLDFAPLLWEWTDSTWETRGSRRNQSQIENECRITVGRPTPHCPRTIIMTDFREFCRGSSRNTTKGKAVIESEPSGQLELLPGAIRSRTLPGARELNITRVTMTALIDDKYSSGHARGSDATTKRKVTYTRFYQCRLNLTLI